MSKVARFDIYRFVNWYVSALKAVCKAIALGSGRGSEKIVVKAAVS